MKNLVLTNISMFDGVNNDGFIFVLATLQIRGWKKWEQETLSHDYEFSVGKLCSNP